VELQPGEILQLPESVARRVGPGRWRIIIYWCDDRKPDNPVAVELYDHQNDPDENVNIAVDQASAGVLKQLTQQWRDGWRKALPHGKLN